MTDLKIETMQRFSSLFRGRADAYGGLKGVCIKKPVDFQTYSRHLKGEESIGIYPLLDDSTCLWSAVDIDMKDRITEAESLVVKYQSVLLKSGIPSYIEISKSKGYHLWVFYTEPVQAKEARRLMAETWRNTFGRNIPEIFPKQDKLSGKMYGNYINLPYFPPHSKEGKRVFINEGKLLTLDDFLKIVKHVTPSQLHEALKLLPEKQAVKGGVITGELNLLPCAINLIERGAIVGYRRPALFRLAAHMHRAGYTQEAAEALIRQVDSRNSPPIAEELGEKELLHHVNSAFNGKEGDGYYSYGCDDQTWVSFFCPGKGECPVYNNKSTVFQKKYVSVKLSDIEKERISFLIDPYIPRGEITFLDGDPGEGKTWAWMAFTAGLTGSSTVLVPYDYTAIKEAKVVVLLTEDSLSKTLRPRLEALGANIDNIYLFKTTEGFGDSGRITAHELEGVIPEIFTIKPDLVIVDPVTLYATSQKDFDSDKAVKVRGLLNPLQVLARELNCAVLICRHFRKGAGIAIHRGMGSIDYAATARSVLVLGKHQETGKKLIAHAKSNLTMAGPALEFDLDMNSIPPFQWVGVVNGITADELTDGYLKENKTSKLDEAKAFLQENLRQGPVPKAEIEEVAKDEGISPATLRRAKSALNIPDKKVGFGEGSHQVWYLPDNN